MPSDELTKLSIDNAPTPQISAEGERAKTNIANARAKRNLGTVSANQLSNPVDTVTVPQPQVSSIPPQSGQLVTNITRDNAGFIAAQTEEARQVKDLQNQFGALNDQGSLSDLFNTTRDQFGGGSDSLKELKDIQLQLTDMDTKSGLNKVNIESGGQGAMQGQRSLTQEDREAAVRSAGLAARASVIQGNIQTANAAAKSAVDIAYQDRTLKSTNLLNQISMVQDKVDEQTAQLLETEKRGYEADLAAVKELKDATQNAIVSGASQAEVSQLMDSTVDDATKLALAQTITARGAGEMRNLDIAQAEANIAQSQAATRSSNRANQPSDTTLPTSVIEQNGVKMLINTQTGEVIKEFGATDSTVGELQQVQNIQTINTIDALATDRGLSKAVGSSKLGRWTPFKIDTMTGDVSNFIATVDNLTKGLTLDELASAKDRGITFGALSEGELGLVADSATKINNFRRTTDGKTTHFEASEKAFKAELDNINNFRKLDAVLKGTPPDRIGVIQTEDGSYWTEDSDGNMVKLR